jgi:hypothetical protein
MTDFEAEQASRQAVSARELYPSKAEVAMRTHLSRSSFECEWRTETRHSALALCRTHESRHAPK